MSETIKIDVWSDIACPWCYIGKRKLEYGIAGFGELHPGTGVDVEFHSFELAPDTPVDFEGSEIDFLAKYKGMPEDQVRGMLDNVTRAAADVGLDYDFDSLRHTRTVKAHELLHYAKEQGRQLEMEERLMKAYFEEGRHVGRDEDLAELAGDIGLDRDGALEALRSGAYLDAVRADQAKAVEFGIRGVPFFVIDGKYGVSGAQAPETFTKVLDRIVEERVEEKPVFEAVGGSEAAVCTDEGCEVPNE